MFLNFFHCVSPLSWWEKNPKSKSNQKRFWYSQVIARYWINCPFFFQSLVQRSRTRLLLLLLFVLVSVGDVPTVSLAFHPTPEHIAVVPSSSRGLTKSPIPSLVFSLNNNNVGGIQKTENKPLSPPISLASGDEDLFAHTPVKQQHHYHPESEIILRASDHPHTSLDFYNSGASRNTGAHSTGHNLLEQPKMGIDSSFIANRLDTDKTNFSILLADENQQHITSSSMASQSRSEETMQRGKSQLYRSCFELVWGHHDIIAFNRKCSEDFIDSEGVGRRIETWPSLKTPRQPFSVSSNNPFFGVHYLASSRFSSAARYKFLNDIGHDFLVR